MERSNWRKRLHWTDRKGAYAANGTPVSSRRARKLPWMAASGVVAFLVLAVLASLFNGAPKLSLDSRAAGPNVPAPQPTAAAMDSIGVQAYDKPASESQPAAGGAATGATGAGGATGATSQDSSTANAQAGKDWDRMIIRTATLQLKVKDVAASMDQVRAMAGAHAGYITQSDSRQEGDSTVATITMQVPAAEFDNTIAQLRKAGLKVLNEQIGSSDVTEEYTDLNSQLRNLQATEQRILALTQKADKIEDILSLDRELRQIQGEIERIQGRVNFLSKRSQMSTITVSLYPDTPTVESAAKPVEGWNPLEVITRAWNASLSLLANIGTLVLTVVVFMWWVLPLLVAGWLFSRRYRRTLPTPPAPIES